MRSKKAFTIASTFALAGGVVAIPTQVEAACPGPTPAAATIVYKDSPAPKNACNAADVKAFNDAAAVKGATVGSLQTAVAKSSAGCATCLFAKDTDPMWASFVDDAQGGFANDSACLQNAPGGSAACGKTYYQFGECVGIVCKQEAATCTTKAAADACADTKGAGGAGIQACLKAFDFVTACGGQAGLQALATACGFSDPNYDKHIMVSCQSGGGPTDAGTDASSGSSGSSGSSSGTSGSSGESSSGSTSGGSSSGKSSTSSGATPDDTGTTSSSSSGCATTGTNENGSLVAALAMVGAGIIGVSRRRKKNEKRAD